jgi:hypothetical protein
MVRAGVVLPAGSAWPPGGGNDVNEKEFQRDQVIPMAERLGYRYYHTNRSVRSPAGFPDLVLVGRRTVFVELKREDGKPTDLQIMWLKELVKAGSEVYVVRPTLLQDLAIILATTRPMSMLQAHQQMARLRLLSELERWGITA